MKKIILLLQSALVLTGFSSCIQDEPLNAECDIVGVDSIWVKQQQEDGLLIGNPLVFNDRVSFIIRPDADRTALSPRFTLGAGVRLTALVDGTEMDANGITRNFTTPQVYTTHSEDGHWHKDYEVSFSPQKPITTLSFENYELEKRQDGSTGRYHVWYEIDETDVKDPRRNYWASGNSGYAFTGMGSTPQEYPTSAADNGVEGKCIKLVTCATGSYGDTFKMPIAAGNLFIGEFNASVASLQPRKATKFGLPLVTERPVKLEGYYKYKAGDTFTDSKKKVRPELHDTADIYAVVYEINKDKFTPLNGDNVLTSKNIVLMARIDKPVEFTGDMNDLAASEWVHFSEPFRLIDGKEFSEERLRKSGYAIAIVMTSSRQGAYFEGAIGSTLYVDELKVVYEGDE